jgi:hypothetical protein
MQRRLISSPKDFYALWRVRACEENSLREQPFPAERLVQAIWQHQRLRRGELRTLDGKAVLVFHPGFINFEGGPDFRGAVLQIGGDAPCSGDVEVDLRIGGWRAHGHDHNPNFQNVLLHVVWEDAGTPAVARKHNAKPGKPVVLCLKNVLDAPLDELSLALENESLRSLPENLRGKCCAPLRELDEGKLSGLLHPAARARFENKAAQYRARARNAGWEQTLWEFLFRALGYKHNAWPMQYLAEQCTRLLASLENTPAGEMVPALQARLLGAGGLLPAELTRVQRSSDSYLRRAWDFWWRERDAFSDVILPRVAWRFHGMRPVNHPRRRLALASHWLADKTFIPKIENWIVAEKSEGTSCRELTKILQVKHDDFWSWHLTLASPRQKKPQPLLGEARVTDLAVNVILPWLWVRAVEGGNKKIQNEAERRFFAWPEAEDNSVLKLARQRLLGTSNAKILKTAAAQQGLIQIVRNFCEHSNATCENCKFPELVRGWAATRSDLNRTLKRPG